jgi:hypothetical protein
MVEASLADKKITVITDIATMDGPHGAVLRYRTHDTVTNFDTGRLEIVPGTESPWQSIPDKCKPKKVF